MTVREDKKLRHLGIILDGNGRWAQARGLERTKGHEAGMENVVRISRECMKQGIEVLSLYAFSTENWKRSSNEVSSLMKLIVVFVKSHLAELIADDAKLTIMGDISRLPFASRSAVKYAMEKTKNNKSMVLNIALNYGGRDEIIRACKKLYNKGFDFNELDEDRLDSEIDTSGLAPLDFIIRTGGERRLSNFMTWQSAYAELYFTETLWPDFSREDLLQALDDFSKRQRRFGGVDE